MSKYIQLAVLLFLIQCGKSEDTSYSQNVNHPTQKNIPDNVQNVIKSNSEDLNLFQKDVFLKIGSEEGSLEKILGNIIDLVFIQNKIVVLDSEFKELRVYNLKGNLEYRHDFEGRGPGEFRAPNRLVKGVDNKLYVSDKYFKIIEYEFNGGDIDYLDTIKLEFSPDDICILGDYLIVRGILRSKGSSSGPYETKIFHKYLRENSEYVNSFGESYISDNPMVVYSFSSGPMLCDKKSSSVIYGFERFPYIYSITMGGSINWTSRFSDFHISEIVEGMNDDGNRTITYKTIDNYSESIYRLQKVDKDRSLIINVKYNVKDDEKTYKSYIINNSNGKGSLVTENKEVINAYRDSIFISSSSSPYPQVKVYK